MLLVFLPRNYSSTTYYLVILRLWNAGSDTCQMLIYWFGSLSSNWVSSLLICLLTFITIVYNLSVREKRLRSGITWSFPSIITLLALKVNACWQQLLWIQRIDYRTASRSSFATLNPIIDIKCPSHELQNKSGER